MLPVVANGFTLATPVGEGLVLNGLVIGPIMNGFTEFGLLVPKGLTCVVKGLEVVPKIFTAVGSEKALTGGVARTSCSKCVVMGDMTVVVEVKFTSRGR